MVASSHPAAWKFRVIQLHRNFVSSRITSLVKHCRKVLGKLVCNTASSSCRYCPKERVLLRGPRDREKVANTTGSRAIEFIKTPIPSSCSAFNRRCIRPPLPISTLSDMHATAQELAAQLAANIRGKVILTTGVSPGGIGAAFAEAVAQAQPQLLILAGRNPAKIQTTADTITKAHPGVGVRTLQLDLSSLSAVRKAVGEVIGWADVPSIDVVVNNAGIMAVEYGRTVDGFETQFGTNHLGPFLFTNLIMKKILAASQPTVVNVSSDGHRLGPLRFADYNFDVCYETLPLTNYECDMSLTWLC